MLKIAIIGAGALGSALAKAFINQPNIGKILLCSRKTLHTELFCNEKVSISYNIRDSLNYDIIFLTVPSFAITEIVDQLFGIKNQSLIICAKGFLKNGELFSGFVSKKLKTDKIMFMYGPNFAKEMSERTYTSLACNLEEISKSLAVKLSSQNLIFIPINDVIGAQICAGVKNIYAIYCGMLKAFNISNNLIATYFTYFLKEILDIIKIYGGDEQTVFDLCGIGDLFLSCTSDNSRNYNFGYEYIKKYGQKINNLLYPEGYFALQNLLENPRLIEAKFCNTLYGVLFEDQDFERIKIL